MHETPQGGLLRLALQTDAMIQAKITIGLADIGADEIDALLILHEERLNYQQEKNGGGPKLPDLAKLQSLPRTS